MKSLLRRNLLLLMLGVTAAAFAAGVESTAFAKNGGDDNSGSDNHGGDDNSGGNGDGNSGSDSHGGDDDDDDNSGSSTGGGSDDDNDGSSGRSASNDGGKNGGDGASKAVRPRIQIEVDAATRAGLLNGTLVAVDNLGRPLEVEADIRNGQTVLTAKPHGGDAKRNPGPIASFEIVPAAQAPVHQ